MDKISTPYLTHSIEKVHQAAINKKELWREVISIIDHLHPRCVLMLGVIQMSWFMGDGYTNERPSTSSSKKGKIKVSKGNKRPSKRKSKIIPNDQLPTIGNSRGQ